ncbi:MAG: hypothetical protein OCD02_21400 [Spirochaetaceae bacterium]
MLKKGLKSLLAIIISGLGMWVIAGLWHNLVLPAVNQNVDAHHDGLLLMLISYFILAGFMTYFYTVISKSNFILSGLKVGILIGVLWVFPHGLTMAGIHDTSVFYEIKNTLWHCFEQGVGGIIVSLIMKNEKFI